MDSPKEKLPEKLNLDPIEVYQRVLEIQQKKQKKIPIRQIEKQCADFFMSYPVIVDKALEGTLDMAMFHKMVLKAQAVKDGKLDKAKTEIEVGQNLAKKFMYPHLTAEQKNIVKEACCRK